MTDFGSSCIPGAGIWIKTCYTSIKPATSNTAQYEQTSDTRGHRLCSLVFFGDSVLIGANYFWVRVPISSSKVL